MAPPKDVQDSANRMVEYFWPQIESAADFNTHHLGKHKLPAEVTEAIALALAVFATSCGTKHCPECVATHQMMNKAAGLINEALRKLGGEQTQ